LLKESCEYRQRPLQRQGVLGRDIADVDRALAMTRRGMGELAVLLWG
jgi:hypothetical protein